MQPRKFPPILIMRRRQLLSLIVLLASVSSFAQIGDILKSAENAAQSNSDTSSLSTGKIAAGLKQALQVSTANAVARTGKPDGFLKNAAIKILLPEKLATIGKGMRMMGMGAPVDELEVGMNRAAEQATPKAKAIFLSALKKMTFDDARKILTVRQSFQCRRADQQIWSVQAQVYRPGTGTRVSPERRHSRS